MMARNLILLVGVVSGTLVYALWAYPWKHHEIGGKLTSGVNDERSSEPGEETAVADPFTGMRGADYFFMFEDLIAIQDRLASALAVVPAPGEFHLTKKSARVMRVEGNSLLPSGERKLLFWESINPDVEFEPTNQFRYGATYRREAGARTSIVAVVTLSSNIHLARYSAVFHTIGSNARPPDSSMVKNTPSSLPLGGDVWSSGPTSGDRRLGVPSFRIVAHDGPFAIMLDVTNDADDPSAATVSIPPIAGEDMAAAEHLARYLLSSAHRELSGFNAIGTSAAIIRGVSVLTKQVADHVTLVLLDDIAPKKGWRVSHGDGLFTLSAEGKTTLLPLAARAAIVEGEEVQLRFPIIQNQDGVWVDIKAFE